MRIGMVCFPTYGGSGALAGELSKALAANNHIIHVISSELPFRLKSFTKNIIFHEVSTKSFEPVKIPQYVLSLASRIIEVCKKYSLEILHLHYAVPHATSGFLARCILGKDSPVLLTTLHGTDITLVGSDPGFFPITKFSIEQSDGITAVSQYLKKTTGEIFGITKEIRVIYNFVDTKRYRPKKTLELRRTFSPDEEKILLHISNFRAVKRIKDVIQIFFEVQKAVDSKLILIGDGEERTGALNLAWEIGLKDKVIFLGKQDNVEDLIPVADLFLFPSETESFGLAALESMSCGVPVIGSKTGGLPEVVEDGRSGFLHPVGSVKNMADSAIKLLKNERLLEEFRRNARNRAVEKFNENKLVREYERFYEDILENYRKTS